MLLSYCAWRHTYKASPVLHSARSLTSPPTSIDENVDQGFFIGRIMDEIWKPVLGYEGQYEVSDKGRIKSYRRHKEGQILRPGCMPQGHLSVALGRKNSQCVHKLVLNAFVGVAPDGYECLHANGNPADNRLENLRWGTRSENIRDAVRHGTWMTPERTAALIKGRDTRWGKK